MKFNIVAPVPPTLEEHRAASAQWLSRIQPLLYENWAERLRNLSFPTRLVEISESEQEAILAGFDLKESYEKATEINSLIERFDGEMKAFGFRECFCRLSSRSPKDAWTEDFTCRSGADVIRLFSSSERILDDLIEYKYADTKCFILLREFRKIPKDQEWRIFIKDKKITGITQYFYHEFFPDLARDIKKIEYRLHEFAGPLQPLLPDNVVVDVWLKDEPLLIEINPYGLSDPCCLTYAELEAGDCGVRFIESPTHAENQE